MICKLRITLPLVVCCGLCSSACSDSSTDSGEEQQSNVEANPSAPEAITSGAPLTPNASSPEATHPGSFISPPTSSASSQPGPQQTASPSPSASGPRPNGGEDTPAEPLPSSPGPESSSQEPADGTPAGAGGTPSSDPRDPATDDAGASELPEPSGDTTATPGCGSNAPLQSGTFTLDVEGTERNYVLEVPSNYDPDHPYPLVFVWHPLGGSASQVVRGGYDGLLSRANGSAVFVAPDGLAGMAAGINGQGWYNTGGGDMKFLNAMLDHFQNNLCIDASRIFSTGFSFGGMMSYAIGCEFADVFRAIAPSSGNSGGSGCRQTTEHPIAVLGLHGDQDDFVATSGGRSARDLFVERNHCGTETVPIEPSPCVEYQGCDAGYPVIWCEYPGEHRPWSQAPATIWNFFSQF